MGTLTIPINPPGYNYNVVVLDNSTGNEIARKDNISGSVSSVTFLGIVDSLYNLRVEKSSDTTCFSTKQVNVYCGNDLCNLKIAMDGNDSIETFNIKNNYLFQKEVFVFFEAFTIPDSICIKINNILLNQFPCQDGTKKIRVILKENDILNIIVDGTCSNNSGTMWTLTVLCDPNLFVLSPGSGSSIAYHDLGGLPGTVVVNNSFITQPTLNELFLVAGKVNIDVPLLDIEYQLYDNNSQLLFDWGYSSDGIFPVLPNNTYNIVARQKSHHEVSSMETITTPYINFNFITKTCSNGNDVSIDANGSDGFYYGSTPGNGELEYMIYNNTNTYGPYSSPNFTMIPAGSYTLKIRLKKGMGYYKEFAIDLNSCYCLPYGTFIRQEQRIDTSCTFSGTYYATYNIYADGVCGTYEEFSSTTCPGGGGQQT